MLVSAAQCETYSTACWLYHDSFFEFTFVKHFVFVWLWMALFVLFYVLKNTYRTN